MTQKTVTFGIGRKLIFLFGGISLGFLIIVALVIFQLFAFQRHLAEMNDFQLPAMRKTSEIKGSVFAQQSVLDDFAGQAEQGNVMSAAEVREQFLTVGQTAANLLGNTPDGRALREYTNLMLERERRHGHLDDEEKAALDYEHIASAYQQYVSKALKLFNMTADDPQFDVIHEQLDSTIHDLQKSLLNYDSQVIAFLHEDSDELTAHTSNVVVVVSVASILIFVAAFWFTLFLVSKITAPLTHLTKVAASIAGSDLTRSVNEVTSGDELELLADSFREMNGNLRAQIEEMRTGIETLGAAINEIGASIQEQAASAKEEAATIQEITTTMQEIQQSGTEISQRAKEVSANADSTLAAGEAGLAAVSKTSESMERIREQIEEVAEKIVSLSEKTQAIGEITATVNEIAEQSNILAINAAIEAASAGESGGRFSVVAQEMKHLADQAKSSTKMVRGILEEIQKGINTAVMLTEEAVKRAESGRAQAGAAQGNIHKLSDSIQSSIQTFQQIIAGTGQQQIGINQVVQGMQDIKQAVQQTVTGISQLEQATRSLNEMSRSLRNLVARYKL